MMRTAMGLVQFPISLLKLLITYLPGEAGYNLRHRFWKRRLHSLGKNVRLEEGVYFQHPEYISIDDNCWIDRGVMILAGPDASTRPRRLVPNAHFPLERGRVHIGKRVHIGPYAVLSGIGGIFVSDECQLTSGVKLYSFSNHYRSDTDPSDRTVHFGSLVEPDRQFMIEGPIFLDENVGVALNSIILPGVSIGRQSFVAINSVVMSSFEANSLIAGHPAQKVRDRFK